MGEAGSLHVVTGGQRLSVPELVEKHGSETEQSPQTAFRAGFVRTQRADQEVNGWCLCVLIQIRSGVWSSQMNQTLIEWAGGINAQMKLSS